MAILTGPDGALRSFGALHKQYRADMLDGALPSWLTLSGSGASSGASSADGGGVAVTTASTLDSIATLSAPSVDLAGLTAIRICVVVSDSATDRHFYLNLSGTNVGGQLQQYNRSDATALRALRAGPAQTENEVPFNLGGPDSRVGLSLLLVTSDNTLALGEGDQIWAAEVFGADMDLGTITPSVAWRTKAAAAVTGNLHQIIIDYWWR